MDIKMKDEEQKLKHYWMVGELFKYYAGDGTYMVLECSGGRIHEYVSLTNGSAGLKCKATAGISQNRFILLRATNTLYVEEVV